MSAVRCTAVLTPLAPAASPPPDSVRYESRGAVLVLGDDAGIAQVVVEVAKHHRATVLAPGIDEAGLPARITTVGSRLAALQGHLGAFRGQVRTADGLKDIGVASPNRDGVFDLVLDLSHSALITADVAPLGYFAPGADAGNRADAVMAMRGLIGSFTKPRYFHYEPKLCAHGASGLTGCSRCLEVCAAEAIVSVGERIRVDPYRCQGCASCTLACPTGALSFKVPNRDGLRRRLIEALGDGTTQAVLVVHGPRVADGLAPLQAEGRCRTLVVDPLPAFGEEQWLEAFALGARAVALVDEHSLAPASRELLARRVEQMGLMLQPFGLPRDRLRFASLDHIRKWLEILPPDGAVAAQPEEHAPSQSLAAAAPSSKRRALLDSIRKLGADLAGLTPVELPAGACFGEVVVDRRRCTLCFACVNLCPTGALSSRDDGTPRLQFAEDVCVQCGLCAVGCPEKAVSLHPRFRPQPGLRGTTRVLNEDSLSPCTRCGTPFIGAKLLASALARLEGHPLLQGGGRERLMICPTCRQNASIQT